MFGSSWNVLIQFHNMQNTVKRTGWLDTGQDKNICISILTPLKNFSSIKGKPAILLPPPPKPRKTNTPKARMLPNLGNKEKR